MANYNTYDNYAFTQDYYSQYDSSISNGEARIPICFCIDTSSSMGLLTNPREDLIILGNAGRKDETNTVDVELKPGRKRRDRIIEVQEVFARMMAGMKQNPVIANAAVVCVVTFDRFADCISEFVDLYRFDQQIIGNIRAGADYTNASKGIRMALERLDRFRQINDQAGNECYTPVLIFMSDGSVREDPDARWASIEVRQRADAGKLKVLSIAIGQGADRTWMRQLSSEARVFTMQNERELQEAFNTIARRIERTAAVIPVDEAVADTAEDELQPLDGALNTRYGNTDDHFLEDILAGL